MKELLSRLNSAFGPSGSEESIRRVIENEIKDHVDEIKTDVLGNLIAVKKGTGKRVMLAAHMDSIGLIVTFIDDNGFLRFSNVGGVSVPNIFHKRVVFKDGLTGIIGYETELEDWKSLKLNKMFIDIGASSREEAAKKVSIGDMAVYSSGVEESCGRYMGAYMDDRAGCAVLIETAKKARQSPHEIYYVFTVQEEVGLRGAKTAAYGLTPDIGIAVDVTLTGDTPKSRIMAVGLGKGPAIKVKDSSVICHPRVKELMIRRAEEAGIPYQLEILEAGGTDSGAIHLTKEGIPSGVLSVPCRYVHSANEMIDKKDLEDGARLLTAILMNAIDI